MSEYVITAPGMDRAEIEAFVFDANLEVNFVKNRSMRVGDYQTARRVFSEVVHRHGGQAFAHYYLARCEDALGASGVASRRRYLEILAGSETWRQAADRFELHAPALRVA